MRAVAARLAESPPLVRGRAAVWRADLVRLLVTVPESQVEAAAAQLGFNAEQPCEPPLPPVVVALHPVEKPAQIERTAQRFPLYRLEEMKFLDESGVSHAGTRSSGLHQTDLKNPDYSMFYTPKPEPLSPWSRLWPALQNALQGSASTRSPDFRKLLRMWSHGEIIHRIPHVTRRVWAEQVALWVDRSPRTLPFRSDQNDAYRRLLECCGRTGLQIRVLDTAEQAAIVARGLDYTTGVRLNPAQPVLVMGDLAAYGSRDEQAAWFRTGLRLRRCNVRFAALLPAPQSLLPKSLAQTWSAVPWERGRATLVSSPCSLEDRPGRAERLLRLASPAGFVQPGLLRALRRLLPATASDAATEADVFRHPDVRSADAMGLVLHGSASARFRKQFADEESPQLKALVSETIRHWHEHVPRELLHVETLTWMGLIPPEEAPPPGSAQDALWFAERLATSLRQGMELTANTAAVKRFAKTMLEALPDQAYFLQPALQPIWAATFAGVSGARVPQGFAPRQLHVEESRTAAPQWWSCRQVGDCLLFKPAADSTWPSSDPGPGSPVAWLHAAGRHLFVRWHDEERERQLVLSDGLKIPLQSQERLTIRSDRSSITIASWTKESWATAAGLDHYGLWADTEVKGVTVRFRWIPPGRFFIRPLASESGRYSDEGPQKEVTLTDGHWLADAPCTQALWQAVMGTNPSRFVSRDRPIEQVSWNNCQEFMEKLNKQVPGLEARLPNEKEWEHACRAGTQTATWLGNPAILGENHAQLLDEIAWYGGNSGQDFELENGYDSSEWLDKQYAHTRAGSHQIRRKRANPFGLFDMLGNVDEWCMDYWIPYEWEAVTDASLPSNGSNRITRGGSWISDAYDVRADSRGGYSSSYQDIYLGFRIALGQGKGHSGLAPDTRKPSPLLRPTSD